MHKKVAKEFVERLTKLTEAAQVGLPWKKDSYMGPVIGADKLDLMANVRASVTKAGGKIVTGGVVLPKSATGGLVGNYVRPTIARLDKLDHRVFREEFFMPFVAVAIVASFEEGIRQANAVEYGLTAGAFTEDEGEQAMFWDRIEAGVCYMNRASGGSTAAVVNGQAFGGWKNSGTTGNGAGGRYYLLQFTREQSRTTAH